MVGKFMYETVIDLIIDYFSMVVAKYLLTGLCIISSDIFQARVCTLLKDLENVIVYVDKIQSKEVKLRFGYLYYRLAI